MGAWYVNHRSYEYCDSECEHYRDHKYSATCAVDTVDNGRQMENGQRVCGPSNDVCRYVCHVPAMKSVVGRLF